MHEPKRSLMSSGFPWRAALIVASAIPLGCSSSSSGTGGGGAGGSSAAAGSGGGSGATADGAAGNAGLGPVTGTGTNGAIRIMPLGDSTTADICYRSDLWQLLNTAGHTNFDMVGTRHGDPGCSFTAYDQDNEGHGGYITADILKPAGTGTRPGGADPTDPFTSDAGDLATWFNNNPADIVLMHFGTNDVANNIAPTTILQAFSAILAKLRTVSPNVIMMVAQITPEGPTYCTADVCGPRITALNAAIPGWKDQNSTQQSLIYVIDQFTGFDITNDTTDGVHANASGAMKIANNWFSALLPAF